ncbi:MAG: trigger factor [Lachnospiraceae bacterium]|nr:trigger factor [Lachnospiraceae bacterium]
MKKRLLAFILGGALILSLIGCGSSRELSNDFITINQYKGLELVKVEFPEITDDDVDRMIHGNLGASSTLEMITDRPAEEGDMVLIDFVGSIDGELFEGGAAENQSLTLGSGAFIGPEGDYRGFEEQVVGHSIGDVFDIQVQFPESYAQDLAGQVANFNITLHEISRVNTPELTDSWVQDNSEDSTTIAEYREEIRAMLEENVENGIRNQQQTEAMSLLLENVEVTGFPEGAVEEETDMIVNYYIQMAEGHGMELADFLQQFIGATEESFREQVVAVAEMAVTRKLAAELIAERERLIPSEEEFQERIEELTFLAGFESVEVYLNQFGEELVRDVILQQVVADFLVDHATFIDPAAVEVEGIEVDDAEVQE